MRTGLIAGVFFFAVAISCAGCFPFLAGVAVARGVAISADTIELAKDAQYDRAWIVVYTVLAEYGEIIYDNKDEGKIDGSVGAASVVIRLRQATPHAVIVTVSSRRIFMPYLSLSERIVNDIDARLQDEIDRQN